MDSPPVRATAHPVYNPHGHASLVVLLRRYARARPDELACVVLDIAGAETETITYSELDRRCRAVAVTIRQRMTTGDRALVLLPSGLDFLVAFFGCVYAGVIAVPVPDVRPAGGNRRNERLESILNDAKPSAILTTAAFAENAGTELDDIERIVIGAVDSGAAEEWSDPGVAADTVALLQYTSGSTSDPKGVVISNGNVIENIAALCGAFHLDRADAPDRLRVVSWLPLFHDMGLMGMLMTALYTGGTCVLMKPMAFLMRPVLWLEAIHRYRATVSGAPNFAYELCVRRIPEARRAELDLSSWRFAVNGSEPVRWRVLRAFSAAFAASGFRNDAWFPGYGLAEATVYVSGRRRQLSSPRAVVIDAEQLALGNVADAVPGAATRILTCCGQVPDNLELIVVDPQTDEPSPDGQVGELWLRGRSVGQGYWQRPGTTDARFGAHLASGEGPFLRTGDLGFIHDGEVVPIGRTDDLIIIDGRNHYPQDIELTVEGSHDALAANRSAAFRYEHDDETKVGVVAEIVRRIQDVSRDDVVRAIRRAVADEHELRLSSVTLLKPGGLPLTTSGKVRRAHTARLLADGGLNVW